MRILYISSTNSLSGSSMALLNIIKNMKSLGHETFVVTSREDGYFIDQLKEIKCGYKRLNLTLDTYPLRKNIILYIPRIIWMLIRHFRGVRTIVNTIQEFHPDIVHTNVGPLSIGYEACRQTGTKHIWHQREYQDKDFGMHFFPNIRSFMRKSHDGNNFNICITNGIFNYRHFREDKDLVIYDGVMSEKNIPLLPPRHEEDYILFVGRIEEAKGLYDVLLAFLEYQKTNSHTVLKVVGDTPKHATAYAKKCHDFIETNHLQEKVIFVGQSKDVYTFMAHAKMMIVASQFEGFGFITAEAMFNGCPVIGRDTGGTKEQFDNGQKLTGKEIGIRFTTHDELVQAMEYATNNDMTDMCQRAKETVTQLYTVEKNVKKVEAFYLRVLNAGL